MGSPVTGSPDAKRLVLLSEEVYIALLNACAVANDFIECSNQADMDALDWAYEPGTRPFSDTYDALGHEWDGAIK